MKTQKATTAKKASSKKGAAKAKPTASAAKPKKQTAKSTKATKKVSRPDSKKEMVLSLLRREKGATLAEIAKATAWQNHSIRGFVSGQLTKKMGLKVESMKSDAGERTYRILD